VVSHIFSYAGGLGSIPGGYKKNANTFCLSSAMAAIQLNSTSKGNTTLIESVKVKIHSCKLDTSDNFYIHFCQFIIQWKKQKGSTFKRMVGK